MENKDKPIVPLYGADKSLFNSIGIDADYLSSHGNPLIGLTKREHFAGLAMQGMLASSAGSGMWPNAEHYAKASVKVADELLKALETNP